MMTRRFKWILLLSLSLAACGTAPESDAAAMRKVLADQVAAWNDGDIEGYMEGYWRDTRLVFTGGTSVTTGWDEALTRYRNAYPDQAAMGKLRFEDLQIERIDASAAFSTGAWILEREADTLAGRFTLVWRKVNGEWFIVADHSS